MKRLLLIIIFFYSCDQKTRYSLNIDIISNDKIYTNNSEINLKSTINGLTIDNEKLHITTMTRKLIEDFL